MLAIAMRYLFVALIVYILLRVVINSIREVGVMMKLRRKLGRQGSVMGELEVVAPENAEYYGTTFTLRRENTIGRSGNCDMVLKDNTISPVHAAVYEKRGKVYLSNYGRSKHLFLNGEPIKHDAQLFDNDLIELGRAALLVHMYQAKETE
jgi:pSer/pThr/pTyr-binding forkhead associated (FHA) protein